MPTSTVPGQQIAKAAKPSWEFKEKKPSNSNPGTLAIAASKERLAIGEAWLWANGTGTCLLDVTTRDTANWMLLATDAYFVREIVLKSLCPGKKPPRCGLWPKGETHTRQDGASEYIPSAGLRERSAPTWHPAAGGGQDLATPRPMNLPPSRTGESLVHPSVLQVGDILGLFTPEAVSKGKGDFPGQSSSLVPDLSRNHAFVLHLPQKAADGWHWYSPFALHCKDLLYQPSWNNAAFLIFSILTEIRDLCWDFCLWHTKKFIQESRLRRRSTDEWDNTPVAGGQSAWSGLKSIAQGDAGGVWKRQRTRYISSIQALSLFS